MYLDTAILVKLLVRESDSLFYADMVDGQMAWSAEIALSECFSVLLRKEREGTITTRHRKAAWKQLEDDVNHHRLNLVAMTRSLLEQANTIMASCHPMWRYVPSMPSTWQPPLSVSRGPCAPATPAYERPQPTCGFRYHRYLVHGEGIAKVACAGFALTLTNLRMENEHEQARRR